MSKIVGKPLGNNFAKYMKRKSFEEITREFLLCGNMIELLVGARVSQNNAASTEWAGCQMSQMQQNPQIQTNFDFISSGFLFSWLGLISGTDSILLCTSTRFTG